MRYTAQGRWSGGRINPPRRTRPWKCPVRFGRQTTSSFATQVQRCTAYVRPHSGPYGHTHNRRIILSQKILTPQKQMLMSYSSHFLLLPGARLLSRRQIHHCSHPSRAPEHHPKLTPPPSRHAIQENIFGVCVFRRWSCTPKLTDAI